MRMEIFWKVNGRAILSVKVTDQEICHLLVSFAFHKKEGSPSLMGRFMKEDGKMV